MMKALGYLTYWYYFNKSISLDLKFNVILKTLFNYYIILYNLFFKSTMGVYNLNSISNKDQ